MTVQDFRNWLLEQIEHNKQNMELNKDGNISAYQTWMGNYNRWLWILENFDEMIQT